MNALADSNVITLWHGAENVMQATHETSGNFGTDMARVGTNNHQNAENHSSKKPGEDPFVIGLTNGGTEVRGTVVALNSQSVTFELYDSQVVLHLSEVFENLGIFAGSRQIYGGAATVTRVTNVGSVLICDATFRRPLIEMDLSQLHEPEKVVRPGFQAFLERWQKFYKILPEYKIAVADMQNFLQELRSWMEQIELGIRGCPVGDRAGMERAVIEELIGAASSAVGAMFERFELAAAQVPEELAPAHWNFCRQQLHPLLLSSPFMHRIYTKPLGYAGDYEMVNMILRDPMEGSSLFAKLLNVFILSQVPAEAHRNRVLHLVERFVQETMRVSRTRNVRVFSIACGPAGEVQRFLADYPISEKCEFALLDTNDETLGFVGRSLTEIKQRYGRSTPVRLVKSSVQQLLKQSARSMGGADQYDILYAAGIFDYLNDRICRTLISVGYRMLAPGGLLVVTNVHKDNPIRNIMEHIYEWHLIYRSSEQFLTLASELPPEAEISIRSDATSNNIIMEVRKPQSV